MRKVKFDENGFTMLEIILSLSIISLLLIFGINLLGKQLETRKRIVDLNTHYHILNASIEIIFRDVQNAYLSEGKARLQSQSKQLLPQFYFRGSSFVFATRGFQSYVRNSPQSNLAFVRYYIDEKSDDNKDSFKEKKLVRVVDTNMLKDIESESVGISQVLVPELREFKVTFWNGSEFKSSWDSK
ncbi:MAG: prepilin-type N-terminal cleavage/methylation domain-containing protein, partial [Silvanigrellaceae bacterium]|nr:prepilin-type N-terminal cleavage/methylation domain-containing protein [Silvanigrellaceae bacterium]